MDLGRVSGLNTRHRRWGCPRDGERRLRIGGAWWTRSRLPDVPFAQIGAPVQGLATAVARRACGPTLVKFRGSSTLDCGVIAALSDSRSREAIARFRLTVASQAHEQHDKKVKRRDESAFTPIFVFGCCWSCMGKSSVGGALFLLVGSGVPPPFVGGGPGRNQAGPWASRPEARRVKRSGS
jgi:hypothetical protein